MKNLFLNNSVNFLTKYNNYSDEEIEKLKYGLEGIYLTLTKLVIIIALSILLNIFREVVITLLLFNIIRYFGFGFHAKKSSECLLISLILFILLPYLLINVNISDLFRVIIGSFSITSFFMFAPADTVKRPFHNKKKRIIRKVLTILVGVIYFILSLTLNSDLAIMFSIALLIQAIIINPLIYKLFGQPYNNFKNFDV